MPRTIEITATYRGEKMFFPPRVPGEPGTIIGEARYVAGELPEGVDTWLAIKGPSVGDDLTPRCTYRFTGHWTTYHNKRTGDRTPQFAFTSFIEAQPVNRDGVIAYLCRHGEGLGIGMGRAATLYTKFGQQTLDAIRDRTTEVANSIPGWTLENAQALAERLRATQHIENCFVEINQLLHRRGFPRGTTKRAIDLWGASAAEVIRRNPYILMHFRGCGFKRCDAMYLDLGHPPGRLKRQALCAWYTIASNTEGHTWHPVETAIAGIKSNVAGAELDIPRALKLAKRAGMVDTLRTDDKEIVSQGGRIWIAERKKSDDETFVARCIAEARHELPLWPNIDSIFGISEHQAETIRRALAGSIGVLGGRPGTGKTYTAAALIQSLVREGYTDDIAVAAPTGKAAVRVTESLAACGIDMAARTIHSLLGVDPTSTAGGGWCFLYRHGNPLPFRFVIVDESSMIDTSLMANLLAARAAGAHFLFIGDTHQLTPVGHGAPLRDLISAGLPHGELTEIRRNSGQIVEVCSAIADAKPWRGSQVADAASGRNLLTRPVETSAKQPAAILDAVREAARTVNCDPVWGCQVIVPVNAKSPVSRKVLNQLLQGSLNEQPPTDGCPFRLGDKIVNTKNGWFPRATSAAHSINIDDIADIDNDSVTTKNKTSEAYVANGEQAAVVVIAEKFIEAKLAGGDTIRIPRGPAKTTTTDGGNDSESGTDEKNETGTGCTWELAYAISGHKSQGAEWPAVVVVIDEYPGAKMVCSREWVYTAISRAKQLCILVGSEETAKQFCRRQAGRLRKTFLAERIKRLQCENLLETC